MNVVKMIMMVFILFGFSFASQATVINLTDTILFDETSATDTDDGSNDLDGYGYGTVGRLDGAFDYVAWTHDFDFNPPYDLLLDATLTLSLVDDECDCFLTREYAIGIGEDGTWDFGEVDTGDYAYNVNVASLTDGEYSVFLKSTWGDFYLTQSELSIDYYVPEPATVLMFSSLVMLLLTVVPRRGRKS